MDRLVAVVTRDEGAVLLPVDEVDGVLVDARTLEPVDLVSLVVVLRVGELAECGV